MNARKHLKFGLVAVAASALIVGLIVATEAAAASGTLIVGSATLAPGAQGVVSVRANASSPGLGAWTVDVTVLNPSQVTVVGCAAMLGGVCNPNYPGTLPTVRFAGASAMGLTGDQTLGTVTVRCASTEGSSQLGLNIDSFADSTVDHPQPIVATVILGTVSCSRGAPTSTPVVATATSTLPVATPTLPIRGIPNTGTVSSHGGDSLGWAIAVLAGAGLASIAGYGLLRRAVRRT